MAVSTSSHEECQDFEAWLAKRRAHSLICLQVPGWRRLISQACILSCLKVYESHLYLCHIADVGDQVLERSNSVLSAEKARAVSEALKFAEEKHAREIKNTVEKLKREAEIQKELELEAARCVGIVKFVVTFFSASIQYHLTAVL